MAGSFIKGGFVKVEDSNKFVIDNNDTIKKRLEELRSSMINMEESGGEEAIDGFAEGIDPVQVSMLVSDDNGSSVDELLDGFSEGLNAKEASSGNIIQPVKSDQETQKDEILAKAMEEAEEIKSKAQEEGYSEGFGKGHSEGFDKGVEEAKIQLENEYNSKFNALSSEYEEKTRELQDRYDTLMNDLEPMLVEKIMDVIKHVTGIELEGNKETIINILKSALENMDNGKHYLIHVSSVDYENVKESKSEIAKGTGLLEEDFDIIEDNAVPSNGALIESEAGIFDCGLGSQLELLKKKLLLISFE